MRKIMIGKKNLIMVIGLVAILMVILLIYRFSIYFLIKINYSMDEIPIAYTIPSHRNIEFKRITDTINYEIQTEKYRFNTPWRNTSGQIKTNQGTLYKFDKKKGLLVYDSDKITLIKDYDKIKNNLYLDNKASDYDLLKLILNSTPDKARFFVSLNKTKQLYNALILKAIYSYKTIYSFDEKHFKGFQFNSPEDSFQIKIIFFDKYETAYQFDCMYMSQEEIDFILSTLMAL